jgi:hypothetical protein
MHDDEYTTEERELFARLARESDNPAGEEDRLVRQLRAEGFLRSPWHVRARLGLAAAAALLCGLTIGWYAAGARSLERQLTRDDLTPVEAAALLERARGAYATARARYVAAAGLESPAQEPSSADAPESEPIRTAGVLWY